MKCTIFSDRQSEVKRVDARMGRPPIENPMSERITVRLDKECLDILHRYYNDNGKDKAEAIRDGIRKLKEK